MLPTNLCFVKTDELVFWKYWALADITKSGNNHRLFGLWEVLLSILEFAICHILILFRFQGIIWCDISYTQ